jgi:hypothetical protein
MDADVVKVLSDPICFHPYHYLWHGNRQDGAADGLAKGLKRWGQMPREVCNYVVSRVGMVETCFSFTIMLGFGRPTQVGRRVFPSPCGPCLVLISFFEKNLPLNISFFS